MKNLTIWLVIVLGCGLLAFMLWPREPTTPVEDRPLPPPRHTTTNASSSAVARPRVPDMAASRPTVPTAPNRDEEAQASSKLDIRILDAIEEALAITDAKERYEALRAIGDLLWTQQDVDAALAHRETMGRDMNARAFLGGIVARWIQMDAEAATTWAATALKGRHDQSLRTSMLTAITDQWAQSDAPTAAAWLYKLGDHAALSALANVLKTWAGTDPGTAARWTTRIIAKQSGHSRRSLISSVATAWVSTDPASALEWLNGLNFSSHERRSVMSSFAWQWSKEDPRAALEYLDTLPVDDPLQTSRQQMVVNLAKTNLEGALQAAARVPDRMRDPTLIGIANACAAENPATALECLRAVIPSAYMATTTGRLAADLVDSEPEIASQMMALIPDQFRDAAENAVIQQWCKRSPADAAEWAVEQPPDLRKKALKQALSQWMKEDPDAASTFVNSMDPELLDEDVRRTAISAYAVQMASSDVSRLPAIMVEAGDMLDRASVWRVASAWASKDPAAAATWAVTLENANLRRNAINQIARQWKSRDKEAARAWANSLTDEGDKKYALRNL